MRASVISAKLGAGFASSFMLAGTPRKLRAGRMRFPPNSAGDPRAAFGGATPIIRSAAHLSNVEQAEVFNRALLNFLKSS